MGEIKIIYTPDVIRSLDDLVVVLYKKEYFGFVESAENYVLDIYDTVPERLKKTTHKKTPNSIKHLGSNYIFYKTNSRTTWYIFFEKSGQNYLITGVINNNSVEVKEL